VFDRAQARRLARRGTRSAPEVRLLTSVARCGVCGSKLFVGHDRKNVKQYICRAKFCVARRERRLDAFVTVAVLERLARPDVAEALAGQPVDDPAAVKARARVDELKAMLDEATAQFTAPIPGERISAATLARIEGELTPQIAEAERAVRRAHVPIDIPDLPDDASVLDVWWDAQDPARQREIVVALIASVTVHRVGKGRRHYEDADVTIIEWRR
jgi:site-specific DNA recombinase